MGEDMNSPYVRMHPVPDSKSPIDLLQVPHKHFLEAAKKVQRQITKEMLDRFVEWRKKSGNVDYME